MALEAAKGLFPTEGLARHEWRRHGSCSGKSPQEYFADVRRARAAITIPSEFDQLTQEREASPLDVQRAFTQANPQLRPGMMAVQCARGFLQEVRICMSADLRDFRPCPDIVRNACKAQSIKIPPSL
jgi:ribonuclease T2